MADPARLVPPIQEVPLAASGDQHTEAWVGFHQDIADALAKLPAALRKGVVDGSDAVAGNIGEYISGSFADQPIANLTLIDLGNISLTAGDWDVTGWVDFTNAAGSLRVVQAWVNTVALTQLRPSSISIAGAFMGTNTWLWCGPLRVSVAAPATAYVGALGYFTSGSASAAGFVQARRMR